MLRRKMEPNIKHKTATYFSSSFVDTDTTTTTVAADDDDIAAF